MSNRVYDILKFIAQIVLPALGTLYAALGLIWNLPYTDEIPKTILAIDAFLGAILGISTAKYNRAELMEGEFTAETIDELSDNVEAYHE